MSEKIEEAWLELRSTTKKNEIAAISNLGQVRYGDGSVDNKCRRYYNETGKFYGGESC